VFLRRLLSDVIWLGLPLSVLIGLILFVCCLCPYVFLASIMVGFEDIPYYEEPEYLRSVHSVHSPEENPSWSPDSKRIAFESPRYDVTTEIYVMNADGSNPVNLTNTPLRGEAAPSWSPDGKHIAFESWSRRAEDHDVDAEIYVMNADGSGATRLTNNSTYDHAPAWSPDGERIAFVSGRNGSSEIYVMNADGSEQTNLTNNLADDTDPSWSPNGKRIAFMSGRDDNVEIYVMNADGSEQIRLTNNPAIDISPSWSPGGERIAFSSTRDGNFEIYVMNADGSEVTRLTDTSEYKRATWEPDDETPAWSPNGTRIAFSSERDEAYEYEIYVVNADGSNPVNLTNCPPKDGRSDCGR
jgi:Tol biopolymer transport system component